MVNRFRFVEILLCLLILLFSGCESDEPVDEIPVDRTVLVYLLANNDLSNDLKTNVNAMISVAKKGVVNEGNLLVYLDDTSGESSLYRITAKGREIVKEYGERNSATREVLREVIDDVTTMYPAKEYGLIFGGHGSGWMDNSKTEKVYRSMEKTGIGLPLTRAFGTDGGNWMNLDDMAAGIPDKTFRFILFDVCYMAGVETAYALRHKTDYIVASGTEVMGAGYPYSRIIPLMFLLSLNLEDICDVFYEYYQGKNATTGVIDCRELEALAAVIKEVRNQYPERYASVSSDRSLMQQFGRNGYKNCFYDLSDFMLRVIGDDEELQQEYNEQMALTVPYMKSSSYFLELPIKTYCGLSTYIPLPGEINDFYDNLEWSKAIND
ncbi:MAG: hypothetical protein J1E02_07080 [Coprobacter sp.]|nr:hypothetical protein [Coprobacter sp.]